MKLNKLSGYAQAGEALGFCQLIRERKRGDVLFKNSTPMVSQARKHNAAASSMAF